MLRRSKLRLSAETLQKYLQHLIQYFQEILEQQEAFKTLVLQETVRGIPKKAP